MNSSPILGKERIATIDILRGFALFGIFLVNMPTFHSPEFLKEFNAVRHVYSGADYWLELFFTLFIKMKFFTIFSFLFGLGFYIFMSRAEEKGLKQKRLFLRRILGLFLFGALHLVLLWSGDILHTYAITGVFLLFFYKRKVKTIVIWAFCLLVIFNTILSLQLLAPKEMIQEIIETSHVAYNEEIDVYMNVYEKAGYLEWVTYRFQIEVIAVLNNLIFTILPVLAMFLFGLAAGKARIFNRLSEHVGFIRKIRNITFLISIPLVIILALYKLEVFDVGVNQIGAIQLLTSLSGVMLCFFYITSLTLLLQKEIWLKRLRPLGYVGQMALTNYLLQSIISVGIFVGLGFFGDVSLTFGTFLSIIIFSLQIIFSRFWLSKFQFGLFEWLWRSFTYGKWQSIKKKEQASNVV